MNKASLFPLLLSTLEIELDTLLRAALDSREEATSEESKAEGKYDMRAQEAAYLAEGQGRLVADLRAALSAYQTLARQPLPPSPAVSLGSLVTLRHGHQVTHYFIGPSRGGLEVELEGQSITVITPTSPLGTRLLGLKPSSTLRLRGPSDPLPAEIIRLL